MERHRQPQVTNGDLLLEVILANEISFDLYFYVLVQTCVENPFYRVMRKYLSNIF